jgi:hypothetical protein
MEMRMMPDHLGSLVMQLLVERPRFLGDLRKLTHELATPEELDWKLKEMKKADLVYRVGHRFFVRSRVIVEVEIRKALSSKGVPEGILGKFMREFHAGARLGMNPDEAWSRAKDTAGGYL